MNRAAKHDARSEGTVILFIGIAVLAFLEWD